MTNSNRFLVVFFLVFAAINLIDFAFYGQNLRNLVGTAGFGLIAYGCHKNHRSASIVGVVLAVGSVLIKYVT
ncbi:MULTISPECIES: hypothetical protein [Stenotrophomonas]|uniref:hypothetical protein n=1 Tax=Stenotrophomonas TaxID=40323 RepID=UPI000A4761A6|nr:MULTISPECIES: hypothetical protein [Stenotrophomonas]